MTTAAAGRADAAPERPATADPDGGRHVPVCIAAESFHPVYAGPAVRFRRYLPGLRHRGIDVSVLTGTPTPVKAEASGVTVSWAARPAGATLPLESLDGVPIHRVRLPDRGDRLRGAAFGRGLLAHCRHHLRPAVIQLLSLPLPGLPWLLRTRRLGVPIIFTRTMLPDREGSMLRRVLLRACRRAPLRAVDCVVVSSGVMREALEELGVRARIEVIPNGVDVTRFRPASGPAERLSARRRLGVEAGSEVVLYVGGVSWRKGADRVFEAWVRLAAARPRARLVVVGPRLDEADPSEAALRRRVQDLIAASGAADRVHFAGLVGDVEAYMRAADVFVFASRREGMPNVVPEAMAVGLAVVQTAFVGLPAEFGRAGREYVLSEPDGESLARQIDALLRCGSRRRELGAAGRRWVVEHMDVERSLDRYAALYREYAERSIGKGGKW